MKNNADGGGGGGGGDNTNVSGTYQTDMVLGGDDEIDWYDWQQQQAEA